LDRNDVMHFSGWCCHAFCVTVFAEWISHSIVFTELPPSVVIAARRCVVADVAAVATKSMAFGTKPLHDKQPNKYITSSN